MDGTPPHQSHPARSREHRAGIGSSNSRSAVRSDYPLPEFTQRGDALSPVHAVACPMCRALPGELCVSAGGRPSPATHGERFRALVG